jgi:hypothetical protein
MSVMDIASGAGLRFEGAPQAGRAGHWWRASTADGTARGALRFDPAVTATSGVVDRVVAAVVATRHLPGLLPVADLVSDAGQVWLITSEPASPTLADLLGASGPGAGGLDPAAALTIARDTGGALAGLHGAGLVHGAFGAETVVVGASGEVWLAEAGLVPALQNVPVPPELDTYAWATLVRTLAGRLGNHPTVDLLHRCSRTAEQATGLAAAVAALDTGAATLGVRTPERKRLAAAAARAGAGTGGAGTGPGGIARPVLAAGGDGQAGAITGVHTLLPDRVVARPEPTADAADQVTRLGQRGRASGDAPGREPGPARLRFGPGAGAASRPPTWPTADRRRPGRRRGRWRGRLRALASGLVTLVLVAGVAAYLWQRHENPLVVTGAVVAAAEEPGDQCDVTVDVVGTIQTNGPPGTISYQWIRSDGETSGVLDQSVPSGRASTQVHLFWSFSGQGRYDATATLRILAPTPMEVVGQFTYACG